MGFGVNILVVADDDAIGVNDEGLAFCHPGQHQVAKHAVSLGDVTFFVGKKDEWQLVFFGKILVR